MVVSSLLRFIEWQGSNLIICPNRAPSHCKWVSLGFCHPLSGSYFTLLKYQILKPPPSSSLEFYTQKTTLWSVRTLLASLKKLGWKKSALSSFPFPYLGKKACGRRANFKKNKYINTLEDWHGTYKSPIYEGKCSSKPPWLCSILIFSGERLLFSM